MACEICEDPHEKLIACGTCYRITAKYCQEYMLERDRYKKALDEAWAYIQHETDKQWRESSPLCRIIKEALIDEDL